MNNASPLQCDGETLITGGACSGPIQSPTPSIGSLLGAADIDDSGPTVEAIAHQP